MTSGSWLDGVEALFVMLDTPVLLSHFADGNDDEIRMIKSLHSRHHIHSLTINTPSRILDM
jgi:hypothetical protein